MMPEVLTRIDEGDSPLPSNAQIKARIYELQRLKDAVVETAKAWKQKSDDGDNEKWSVHYVAMCEAIDALIEFESKKVQT